ncbi:hypothetical protein [Yoonia sp. 208BN28-4]|uniref:hypothetical protein n=1 Tax=Yoonia sp. 208BN28-4 TaxID=3126505 RepID=UPI0030B2D678
MPFPFALVSQGVSLLSGLIGGGGSMSAAAQLEIVRQLGQVNQNLMVQTEFLKQIVDLLAEFHAAEDIYKRRSDVLASSEKLSDILKRLTPARGDVTDLDEIYADLTVLFDSYMSIFDQLEILLEVVKDRELSLVDLSFPIVVAITNLRLLADIMLFPDVLANMANEDRFRASKRFEPEPHISSGYYQAIIYDISSVVDDILASQRGYFATFKRQFDTKFQKHTDADSAIPGKISITAHGFRQQRYGYFGGRMPGDFVGAGVNIGSSFNNMASLRLWTSRRQTVKNLYAIPSKDVAVRVDSINDTFPAHFTGSGDQARYQREDYGRLKGRKAPRLPSPVKRKAIDRKAMYRFFDKNKKMISSDSRNLKRRKQSLTGLTMSYFTANEFDALISNDFEHIRKSSPFSQDVEAAESLIGIWIYMEGFKDFLEETQSELLQKLGEQKP